MLTNKSKPAMMALFSEAKLVASHDKNVCAKYFEIERQPSLVASLNMSPRPCACMGFGPFSISPAWVNNPSGAISSLSRETASCHNGRRNMGWLSFGGCYR